MSNKFSYGDHVKISRFPEHTYQILEVRQLIQDTEPHYYLQSLTTPANPSWIGESSLDWKFDPKNITCR